MLKKHVSCSHHMEAVRLRYITGILFLVLLMTMSGAPQLPTAAQTPSEKDVPYILYYSDYLNALVIEHVDGTDSRIFGEGNFPPHTWFLDRLKWSSTGDWLAFAVQAFEDGWRWDHPIYPTVISVDNQKVLQSLSQIDNVSDYEWSDTENFLLVSVEGDRIYDREIGDRIPFSFHLVDADTDEIVSSVQAQISNEDGDRWLDGRKLIYWLPEKRQFVIVYVDPISSTLTLQYMGADGETTVSTYPVDRDDTQFSISPDGWLLFPKPESNYSTHIMLDLHTGETHELALHWIHDIVWGPNGHYVAVEDAIPDPELRSSYQWDRSVLILDRTDFSLTEVEGASIGDYAQSGWSSDGQYILLYLEQRVFGIYDTLTRTVAPIPLGIDTSYLAYDPPIIEWRPGNVLSFSLTYANPESEPAFEWETIIYLYDADKPAVTRYDGPSDARISPDAKIYGHYLETHGPFIASLDGDFALQFPTNSRNRAVDEIGRILWHEDSYWFMVFEGFPSDGGILRSRLLSVANIDGGRRELGFCAGYCLQWLPEQVDLDKLPPGQPATVLPSVTPPHTLPEGEIYWSEDGQYIQINEAVYNVTTAQPLSNIPEDIVFRQFDQQRMEDRSSLPYRLQKGEIIGTDSTQIATRNAGVIIDWYLIPAFGSRREENEPLGILLDQDGLVIDKTSQYSGTLAIWDLNQGELVAYLPIPVRDLSVSPTQTHIAVTTKDEVQLWTLDGLIDLGIMVEPRRWR